MDIAKAFAGNIGDASKETKNTTDDSLAKLLASYKKTNAEEELEKFKKLHDTEEVAAKRAALETEMAAAIKKQQEQSARETYGLGKATENAPEIVEMIEKALHGTRPNSDLPPYTKPVVGTIQKPDLNIILAGANEPEIPTPFFAHRALLEGALPQKGRRL